MNFTPAQSWNYKLVLKSLPTMTKKLKVSSNLPIMTKRAKWKTNMMTFSIHGEKIRFLLSQRKFLNHYDSQFFHFHQKTQHRICIPIYWLAWTIARKFVFIPAFDKTLESFLKTFPFHFRLFPTKLNVRFSCLFTWKNKWNCLGGNAFFLKFQL